MLPEHSFAVRSVTAARAAAGERPTLKDLLKDLRLRAGLSQRQLAEATGMEQPNIARMESGQIADPKLSTLRRLATALGTDLETVAGAFV